MSEQQDMIDAIADTFGKMGVEAVVFEGEDGKEDFRIEISKVEDKVEPVDPTGMEEPKAKHVRGSFLTDSMRLTLGLCVKPLYSALPDCSPLDANKLFNDTRWDFVINKEYDSVLKDIKSGKIANIDEYCESTGSDLAKTVLSYQSGELSLNATIHNIGGRHFRYITHEKCDGLPWDDVVVAIEYSSMESALEADFSSIWVSLLCKCGATNMRVAVNGLKGGLPHGYKAPKVYSGEGGENRLVVCAICSTDDDILLPDFSAGGLIDLK